jgi:hypothetical protein
MLGNYLSQQGYSFLHLMIHILVSTDSKLYQRFHQLRGSQGMRSLKEFSLFSYKFQNFIMELWDPL